VGSGLFESLGAFGCEGQLLLLLLDALLEARPQRRPQAGVLLPPVLKEQ